MTDEKKAKEIASVYFDKYEQKQAYRTMYGALLRMAEWKNNQFKKMMEREKRRLINQSKNKTNVL